MRPKALAKITKSLKTVLRELAKEKLKDRNTRCQYAEYLVAKKLTDIGHEVLMFNEREDKSADIFLARTGEKVEVKSSCFYDDGWAYASFANGNQIKQSKFDYCVWLVFDDQNSDKPKKTYIFRREELLEVGRARKNYANHESNSCLLTFGQNLKDYDDHMKKNNFQRLKIERELLKNQRKFTGSSAWSKLRKAK